MQATIQSDPSVTPLSSEDMVFLYQALAHLYVYTRAFERALELYLLLKDSTVFTVIKKHRLFKLVSIFGWKIDFFLKNLVYVYLSLKTIF